MMFFFVGNHKYKFGYTIKKINRKNKQKGLGRDGDGEDWQRLETNIFHI